MVFPYSYFEATLTQTANIANIIKWFSHIHYSYHHCLKILWQVQKSWCKNLSWRKTSFSQSVANQLIETFNSFFKTNIQFSQWGQKICEVAFKPLYSHLDLMIVWISKHCGRTLRGVRGVKRSEILWGIQKYSLPGRPSTHHWVKSKTIIEKHQKLRKRIINQLLVNFLAPIIFFDLKIEFFRHF